MPDEQARNKGQLNPFDLLSEAGTLTSAARATKTTPPSHRTQLQTLTISLLDEALTQSKADAGFVVLALRDDLLTIIGAGKREDLLIVDRNIGLKPGLSQEPISLTVLREISDLVAQPDGAAFRVVDVRSDPQMAEAKSVIAFNLKSILLVPLIINTPATGARTIGTLFLSWQTPSGSKAEKCANDVVAVVQRFRSCIIIEHLALQRGL